METIGSRLRQEREAQGIDRKAFAKATGIGYSTIAELERGGMQTSTKLRVIAEALGVSLSWLETGKGPKKLEALPDLAGVDVASTETPSPYVRIQQIDAEAGMGGEVINDDYPDVIRAMDFTQEYIRGIVGFVPPPGRLILMTGRGDSMVPTIQPGDTVVVDTGVTSFDGDGLYLINMGSGHQIKRLVDRGSVHVASDNRAYGEPFQIPDGTVIGGKVYLRNRIERFN